MASPPGALSAVLGCVSGRVVLNDLVRACEEDAGRPVRPFVCKLDFVRWPDPYERVDAENHLVLSIAYLETEGLPLLRTLLRLRLAELA